MEAHIFSSEKKFKSARTTGKVMMTVFWDMKGHITVDFLEKGTTMNSERYYEILNTVRHDVYSKRRGLTSKGVLYYQDNARPHTAKKTLELIKFWKGSGSPSTLQSRFGTI